MGRALRPLRWVGLAALVAATGWGIAMGVLGLWPVGGAERGEALGEASSAGAAPSPGAASRAAAAPVTIFVRSNGVHTDLVLPIATPAHDWRASFPAADFARPDPAATHYAIGWGHLEFYLATPTWADVRPGPLLRAGLGLGGAGLHVELATRPAAGPTTRPVVLSAAGYARLVAFVEATRFGSRAGVPGRALAGYGARDVFYPAAGRVNLVNTCNEWTRRALSAAGVRTAAWAPLAWAVMYHLPDPPG